MKVRNFPKSVFDNAIAVNAQGHANIDFEQLSFYMTTSELKELAAFLFYHVKRLEGRSNQQEACDA